MAIIFAFVSFLFYRIMTSAMFYDPMTILGCAITAIVVSLIVAFSSPFAFFWSSSEKDGELVDTNPAKYAVATIGICIICSVAAFLITLGFSEKLFNDISRWSGYKEFYEQEFFWFCVVISIPVMVHMWIVFRQLISDQS